MKNTRGMKNTFKTIIGISLLFACNTKPAQEEAIHALQVVSGMRPEAVVAPPAPVFKTGAFFLSGVDRVVVRHQECFPLHP